MRGRRRKTKSSKLGLSFAAQPAAFAIEVNRTLFAKAFSSMPLPLERERQFSRRGRPSPAAGPLRERKHYTFSADGDFAPRLAAGWPMPRPMG
jgi:hypothetical protein